MKLSYFVFFVVFSVFLVFLTGCTGYSQGSNSGYDGGYGNEYDNEYGGEYDAFAQCLTEKGVIMYGTEWCSHCKNQKAMFGDSFQYVNYIDCEVSNLACSNAGIRGYPTWNIEGNNYPGEQSFAKLAELSGCTLEG